MCRDTCDLCGHDDARLLYLARDLNYGQVAGEFRLVRCVRCGLIRLDPRPPQRLVQDHYEQNYEMIAHEVHTDGSSSNRRSQRYQRTKAGRLSQLRPPGRLLDVGCGSGEFLALMRQCEWHVFGVEVTSSGARLARETYGLDVFCGTLAEASFPDEWFDVVTFYGVLDYLPSPRATLCEVHRILAPGGIVVVSSPNMGSLQARAFRAYWYHLDVPRHTYFYSLTTLKHLLQATGFEPFRVDYFCYEYHGSSGILRSLANVLRSRATPSTSESTDSRSRRVKRTAFSNVLRSLVKESLIQGAAAVAWLESVLGYGAHPTVYARKV